MEYLWLVIVFVTMSAWTWMIISSLFSAVHASEEVFGEGAPFWDYAANLAKLPHLPYLLGLAAVGIALPAALVFLAYMGYVQGSVICLSLLLGARVGDTLFSHWLPWLAGARPNPGAYSSLYCAAEAVLLFSLPLNPWLVVAGAAPFALLSLTFLRSLK